MSDNTPFSLAAEQNRVPILAILQEVFTRAGEVLEIGAGTGQHAAYFAQQLAHVTWWPTEQAEALAGLMARTQAAGLSNLKNAQCLDVSDTPWPVTRVDYVYSANTLHIMDWLSVQAFFQGVGKVLAEGGDLCVYGPFNINNDYTSESNRRFDQWLKARDPRSGIRDMAALDDLARQAGLQREGQFQMPANNLILQWRKQALSAN